MISHKSHLERDARFERVTERGGVAAVRHGNHHVGLDGKFTGQLAAHFDSGLVHVPPGDGTVWPRKIDVLENTETAALLFCERLNATAPVLSDDDNFAGSDVADKFGVD